MDTTTQEQIQTNAMTFFIKRKCHYYSSINQNQWSSKYSVLQISLEIL